MFRLLPILFIIGLSFETLGASKTSPAGMIRFPEIKALDQENEVKDVPSFFASEDPMMVQFIFTSCQTICPAMSAIFAQTQKQMAQSGRSAQFVSISIDPEYDRPPKLAAYAKKMSAQPGWTFLTGSLDDMAALQKAFGVYQGNKMWHDPITYLKAPGKDGAWKRFNTFLSPAQLVKECESLQP